MVKLSNPPLRAGNGACPAAPLRVPGKLLWTESWYNPAPARSTPNSLLARRPIADPRASGWPSSQVSHMGYGNSGLFIAASRPGAPHIDHLAEAGSLSERAILSVCTWLKTPRRVSISLLQRRRPTVCDRCREARGRPRRVKRGGELGHRRWHAITKDWRRVTRPPRLRRVDQQRPMEGDERPAPPDQ